MFSHVMVGTKRFRSRQGVLLMRCWRRSAAGPGNVNESGHTGHKRAFWFHNGGIFAIKASRSMMNRRPAPTARTIGFACDSLETGAGVPRCSGCCRGHLDRRSAGAAHWCNGER